MTVPQICFDARMAHASGIGTYIRGLLGALSAAAKPAVELTVIVDRNTPYQTALPRIPLASRFYSLSEQVTVPWAFRRSRARLLHSPHYNIPAVIASQCVVTVHDLIHLKFPQFLPSKLALAYANVFFRHWIPRVKDIFVVSENTKKDLIEMLKIPAERITVTYPGVTEGFRKQTLAEYQPALQSLKLPAGYFLYVGNLKEFKNTPRLLQAYQLLLKQNAYLPPLVLVGKNFIPGFEQVIQATTGVIWLPDVNHAMLPAVYAGALGLIFPSLYEGFGLPPLEAMACGTPVICSNRGSLPEVVGDAAVQVDPLSIDEIAQAMKRLWQTPSLALGLSDKGLQQAARFHWAETARKTLSVYQKYV